VVLGFGIGNLMGEDMGHRVLALGTYGREVMGHRVLAL